MPSNIQVYSGKYKVSSREIFEWLRLRGYSPIEIKPRSKEPNSGEGWSTENYTVDPTYFDRPDANIGARLGRGGLRDVDIDCEEAAFYASRLLPATDAIFGRSGAPDTHWLYEIQGEFPKFETVDPVYSTVNRGLKKDDPKYRKAAIIDFRSLGQYTVFPGSTHPSGESIEWGRRSNPDPARPEHEDVITALKLISICVMIERHLWLDGMRHDVCRMLGGVFYFLEFDLDTAEALIGLVMERTGDDDPSRLKTIRQTYKKADEGKKTEGRTKLKAFVPEAAPCLDKWFEWFGGKDSGLVEEYNEKFAVVRYGSDIRIAAFFANKPVEFLKKAAFHDLYATDTVQFENDKGKMVRVAKSKIWWASPKRAQYNGLSFDPSAAPGEELDDNYLNLWRGWGIAPADVGWAIAKTKCKMWLDHLRVTICDEDPELYAWCLAWFADIFRNPGRKPGTSLALLGGQGAGKTSVFEYLRPILRTAYVRVAQPSQLTGNFNAHFQNCLFLHAEEAIYAKSHATISILKDMITSDTLSLEKKGQDIVSIPSYKRLGFTSNADHMIGVGRDDRRFTFINLKRREKDESRTDDYDRERDGEGPANLFRYLLDCPEIDPNLARRNFATADISIQKFQTFDPIAQWWHEALNSGNLLHPSVNWCQRPQNTSWPNAVSSSALYVSFLLWEQGRRFRDDMNAVIFFNRLRDMMNGHANLAAKDKRRLNFIPPDEDSPPAWRVTHGPAAQLQGQVQQSSIPFMPDLAACRREFEKWSKLVDYEWDDVTSEIDAAMPAKKPKVPLDAPAI